MRPAPIAQAAALLAFTLVAGWQVRQYRELRGEEARAHAREGALALAAVEGLALREFRGGRFDREALAEALSGCVAKLGLASCELATARGGVLARAAGPDDGPTTTLGREVSPTAPRLGGRGPRWLEESAEELAPEDRPLALTVALPTAPLRARLAHHRTRFALALASLATAAALLAAVARASGRAAALRATLAAQEREVAHLARLGRIGAGLLHETKNPLAVVRGHAERLAVGALAPDAAARAARSIVDETDRALARLDEFLLFSRPARPRPERVELASFLRELAEWVGPDAEAARASVVVDAADVALRADPDQLRRLLLNLVLNALREVPPGGEVRLVARAAARGGVVLAVEDDGPGVPAALEATLFEPYVTGREGGSGLGLAIAARIAAAHGFTLRHERRAPRGARFVVEAPA